MSAFTIPPNTPVLRPLDPRTRLLLVALRRALLVLADALAVYCDLPEKGVR